MAKSVMSGFKNVAKTVIAPSNTNTGIAEKAHPFPRDQVITMMMIKSNIAFVASSDQSPKIPS